MALRRKPFYAFRVSQAALLSLPEGGSLELSPVIVEPLVFSATLRVIGDEAVFALAARAPPLEPFGELRLAGEAGLIIRPQELWRARAFSGNLAAPPPSPESGLATLNFGKRGDLLRLAHWAPGYFLFGLLLGPSELRGSAAGAEAKPKGAAETAGAKKLRARPDQLFLDPAFASRRLQSENRALKAQLRQLGETLDTVLEAACPSAPLGSAPLEQTVLAAVDRGDRAELRALQAALSELQAAVAAGLGGPDAGREGAPEASGAPETSEAPGARGAPDASASGVAEECCVCLDHRANTTFLPCKHTCCCAVCSVPLAACPLCRAPIVCTKRIIAAAPAGGEPAVRAGDAARVPR